MIPRGFYSGLRGRRKANIIYVEIAGPEGFGGNSAFFYLARFNKMQTLFWGGASHYTNLDMCSPTQSNNLFCGEVLPIKNARRLEPWRLGLCSQTSSGPSQCPRIHLSVFLFPQL